jgi:hypothetical protein
MNFRQMAFRVAGLTQPLSERPDYGTANRLQERVKLEHPERLKDWSNTSSGRDLLHLIKTLRGEMKKEDPKAIPYLLENLANSATESLLYIKS